ncbi:MerR family transcriptional regulator [Nocardia sp. NPDC020380]|uniref:MerR family transcriptional regulator n=1 Tax=Nocardia sp. NPDC020380 TaxID=3364309 RepID=UPI003793605F
MKIGELAQVTGASPKAIRRYEELGLVAPVRLANGYREFDEWHVRAVREIRALNRLGIAVEDARPFLECLTAGGEHGDDCPASLAEYRKAIDEVGARISALTARKEALEGRLREAAYRNSGARLTDSELLRLPEDLPVPVDDGGAAHLVGRELIEHVFYPVFPPDRHAEQVLDWLRANLL